MGARLKIYDVRPFAADMPEPIDDESLLGFVSRALDRTLIVKLKHGLALANVRPAGSPAASISSMNRRKHLRPSTGWTART